jgi:hypothetical protein
VAYVVVLNAYFILGSIRSAAAETIGTTFLFGGFLWLVASAALQFWRRNWTRGLVTIALLFGGTIMTFIVYAIISTATTMIDGDHWADELTIPEDISLFEPIDERPLGTGADTAVVNARLHTDLELYNSFQPGIYLYDVWLGRIERGVICLKAYEVTQGDALSSDQLVKSSRMEVYNPSASVRRFKSAADFTIYEGDWGKPYAARFEVWFKPATGGPEVKLIEKNYKIVGWMH